LDSVIIGNSLTKNGPDSSIPPESLSIAEIPVEEPVEEGRIAPPGVAAKVELIPFTESAKII
jgi:hypothetical protein